MPELLIKKDRKKIEDIRHLEDDVKLGKVAINRENCTGCGYCIKACAAAFLEVLDNKCGITKDQTFCVSCGDCVAICPENAIKLVQFLQFKRFFKYLDRGEPKPPRIF